MRRRDALKLLPAALLPMPAYAQAFPARPIRMVIPFTAGGSNDIVGRILAEGMSARLGQPIVIENRGGAGGNSATGPGGAGGWPGGGGGGGGSQSGAQRGGAGGDGVVTIITHC
jgi:hypothetical protein